MLNCIEKRSKARLKMKKTRKQGILISIFLVVMFILWTYLVCCIDIQEIGPNGSSVGFATLNGYFHDLTGTNMTLYTITDWLGLVPIAVALGFAFLGLVQWIRRKSFFEVDRNILALGGFYIAVIAVYVFFEYVVINYRPVLIEGYLEASYPSSTTMLVMCVMPTAMMQLRRRIKNRILRGAIRSLFAIFTVFMVVGRVISGVHWISDVIGGVIISAGLVSAYYFLGECGK